MDDPIGIAEADPDAAHYEEISVRPTPDGFVHLEFGSAVDLVCLHADDAIRFAGILHQQAHVATDWPRLPARDGVQPSQGTARNLGYLPALPVPSDADGSSNNEGSELTEDLRLAYLCIFSTEEDAAAFAEEANELRLGELEPVHRVRRMSLFRPLDGDALRVLGFLTSGTRPDLPEHRALVKRHGGDWLTAD